MPGGFTAGCPNVVRTICGVGHKAVSKNLAYSGLILSALHTGSSADPIVGQFAVTYHDEAAALGIDLNDLYSAMLADGQNTPPDWDIEGRQADAYMYACL